MKKIIIKITTATVCVFISLATLAQKADAKRKSDEPSATPPQSAPALAPSTVPAPNVVTAQKVFTVNEQPKPIIPGGEFKPKDTDKISVPNKTQPLPQTNTIVPPNTVKNR